MATETLTEKQQAARAGALDRAAEGLAAVQVDARKVATLAAKIERGLPDAPTPGDVARAVYAVGRLADTALADVLAAGGTTKRLRDREAQAERSLDLADLAIMQGETAMELLLALRTAVELAEQLDAERGRTVGEHITLQEGESRGTDYAESLSTLVLQLRGEMFGRVGAGRE